MHDIVRHLLFRLALNCIGVLPFVLAATWLYGPAWQDIAAGSLFLACVFVVLVVVLDGLLGLLGRTRRE